MSWGAQNRSKDAKTPSAGLAMSQKPELDCCPVQPYSPHSRSCGRLITCELSSLCQESPSPRPIFGQRVLGQIRRTTNHEKQAIGFSLLYDHPARAAGSAICQGQQQPWDRKPLRLGCTPGPSRLAACGGEHRRGIWRLAVLARQFFFLILRR
jgi:hypothetical protein